MKYRCLCFLFLLPLCFCHGTNGADFTLTFTRLTLIVFNVPVGIHYKDTPQEVENLLSEDLQTRGNLDAQNYATALHLESPYNNGSLKPKMLKFKKEKDDKLHLPGSPSQTKPNRGETSSATCVGDDADTDFQTMWSYLDDPHERVHVKSCEQANFDKKGICGAAVRSQRKRSFFVSLKDADAKCALVVCKKGTGGLPKQEKLKQYSSDNEQVVEEVALAVSYRTKRTENESCNHNNELERSCAKEACSDQVNAVSNCLHPLDSSHVDFEVAGWDQNHSSSSTRMTSSKEAIIDAMNIHVQHLPSRGLSNTTCRSHVDGSCSLCSRQDQCEQDFVDKNELNIELSHREGGEKSVDLLGSFDKCLSSDRISSCCSNGPAKLQEQINGVQITMESHGGDSSDEFELSKTRKAPSLRPSVRKKGRRQKTKRRLVVKTKPGWSQSKQKANRKTVTPPGWSCTACTFINDGQLVQCSICLTPRVTTKEPEYKEQDTNILSNQGWVKNDGNRPVGGLVDSAFENIPVHVDSLRNTTITNNGNSATINQTTVQCRRFEGLSHNVNNFAMGCSQSCSVSGSTATENESIETVQVNRGRLESCDSSSLQEQDEIGDSSGRLRDPPPWSCSACTFLNQWQMVECSLCLTPRRRSQRHRASQWSTSIVDRRRKEHHNKKSSEQEGSPGSGDVFLKVIPEYCKLSETETVPIRNSCSQTSLMKAGDGDLGMKTDDTRGVEVKEGLTPEPGDRGIVETLNRVSSVPNNNPCFQSCSDFTGVDDSSLSIDDSASLRSHPRKRFKLDDCQIDGASEDSCGISDFSDDSDQLLINCQITSGASSPKNANLETSSLGDDLQPELSSPVQMSTLDNWEKETLEGLEAAANEMFSASDWEEEDFWCEAGAYSGQSSLPSSNETVSSGNQGLGTPTSSGFGKCSDLFSLSDLQNKLFASPNLEKIESLENGNYGVNAKQTLPTDVVCNNKISSTNTKQESTTCSLLAEIEEDQHGEPAPPPGPMKLKFCLSFYTDRVYLYDEVGGVFRYFSPMKVIC